MRTALLRIRVWAVAAGIASAFVLAAPEPAQPAGAGKANAERPSSRFAMQARSGTLKTYRAGQSVVFAGPDGRLKRLPVDPAARVDRGLVRGQQVNVISMTDETGRERVSAISRGSSDAAQNAAAPRP